MTKDQRVAVILRLTMAEVSALHAFLAVNLNDPDTLAQSGMDRREQAAVVRAAVKVTNAMIGSLPVTRLTEDTPRQGG